VNVKQYRDEERYLLKKEYQKFKRKTDPLFLLFVLIQLFTINTLYFKIQKVVTLLFQAWLLYYYVTLALRENILKVNGSNINLWWIIHHYLSIGMTVTILTWNAESTTYLYFLPQFLYFSLLQALVQILQNKYQSDKLYKLIAMEKADKMQIVPGDTPLELGSLLLPFPSLTSSVSFLLPFLLSAQCFQIYNSVTLLKLAFSGTFEAVEWQVYACGILFFSLGVGNLSTTLFTVGQKYKH